MLKLPTFAELAGDVEPRVIEAARLYRQGDAKGEAAARSALIGATDVAAREGALRWLESTIADKLKVHEMIEGPRDGSAEWDLCAIGMFDAVLAPLCGAIDESPMAKDDDWPAAPVVLNGLAHPSTRGDATRLLRDMWWRAMQTQQIVARNKPGAFLASVGIVASHVAELLEDDRPAPQTATVTNASEEPVELVVDGEAATVQPGETHTFGAPPPPPPRADYPAMPPNITAERAALPGQTPKAPEFSELRTALHLFGSAQAGGEKGALYDRLDVSRSTWGNWASGRTEKPRVTFTQAQVMAAECARLIGDLTRAEEVFRRVRP